MNKKSGQTGTPVEPAPPKAPQEADKADPGEIEKIKAEQRKTQTGKYGSVKVTPFKPESVSGNDITRAESQEDQSSTQPENEEVQPLSWIEIELVGEDDKPIPGEKYRVLLPDGRVDEGTLDHNGWASLEGFESGPCKITFPELDQEAWTWIESVGPRKKESNGD